MIKLTDTLFIITARGGSKGIPGKNIKPLGGKPLICYSIDMARKFSMDENICLSTDDKKIIEVAENYGLKVPFVRPSELATDMANSNDVLVHAINYYKNTGKIFSKIILMQPTSPFRNETDLRNSIELFDDSVDMVVSVKESESNPYYNLYENDKLNFLIKSKESNYTRRQDCPTVYQFNGAIYIINTKSLLKFSLNGLKKIKGYVMDEISSVDLDNQLDWMWAEFLLEKNLVKFH